MDNKEFLSVLEERYGVMPPGEYDQDWEFTAGDSKHTEDYIDFYHEFPLTPQQKTAMINMIIEGFEDLIWEQIDQDILNKIWDRIKMILLGDKQLHYQTIVYWSCFDIELEKDRWRVSKFMRELLASLGTVEI